MAKITFVVAEITFKVAVFSREYVIHGPKIHISPAAKGGDPKFSDLVFFSADYLSLGSK